MAGDRRALARLLTAVENRTPSPRRPAAALSDGRQGAPGRHHRAAGLGQVDARRGADRGGPRGRPVGRGRGGRPVGPITGGALLGDRVRMQAYAEATATCSSARWRRAVTPAASPRRRRPRPRCSMPPASTWCSSRRSGPARARSRSRRRPTRPSCSRRPRWATRSRRSRPGLLEVADLVVVNKGDRPGAQRTAAQLRAMLVADRRPVGTRPIPTARAQAAGGPGHDRARPARACRAAGGAGPASDAAGEAQGRRRRRLARAEAQVWAIVLDRLGAMRLRRPGRDATRRAREVAEHRLDPYAAADRLLVALADRRR